MESNTDTKESDDHFSSLDKFTDFILSMMASDPDKYAAFMNRLIDEKYKQDVDKIVRERCADATKE
jgi:hypothetical protein